MKKIQGSARIGAMTMPAMAPPLRWLLPGCGNDAASSASDGMVTMFGFNPEIN